MQTETTSALPCVTLAKGRERSVTRHHPWIFSGAIAQAPDALSIGETVAVASADGEILGYGSFSPMSQIRVRMLSFDAAKIPNDDMIAQRVSRAVARRENFFAKEKVAMRLIQAESDGLPGVIADWYDGFIICQLSSAGAEFWKSALVRAFAKIPGVKGVAARNDLDIREKEGLAKSAALEILAGEEPPEKIEIAEGAVRFFVDVRNGHKTGFYLDQRDARALVATLARNRDVLNCFSFTGGFGLAAAAGGAKHVTQVDISATALALAKENAELTPGASACTEFVEADVFKFLRTCRDSRKTFDLIVLDPPKFADTKAHLMKAMRGYKDINLLAMKLLRPGGILATFSCSGAMTSDLFDKVVFDAAQDAHRDFQILSRTRQAIDHPVALNFPEGFYLKGLILRECSDDAN